MPTLIDISGQRFGTFTVCGRAPGSTRARSAWWLASCDCGAELPFRGDYLRAGKADCPDCGSGRPRRERRIGRQLSDIIEANSEFVTECGCRLWTGYVDANGYGRIFNDGISIGAHRAAWTVDRGPIPCGLHVLHRCDTPPCINSDHLFLGTQADNVADMMRKQRHRHARRHVYR